MPGINNGPNSAFQPYHQSDRVSTTRPVQPVTTLPSATVPINLTRRPTPPPPPAREISREPSREVEQSQSIYHIQSTLHEIADSINDLLHRAYQLHQLLRTVHHQINVDQPYRHRQQIPEPYQSQPPTSSR